MATVMGTDGMGMMDDGDDRRARDSHGKEVLEMICHVLDDCGRFFKCVTSNLEAGRPDSSILMF